MIIYLESLYNKLYFDMKFIWKYWKMNSKSWQDGLFHGTKWQENYQCSRLWCQIILLMIISGNCWPSVLNYLLTALTNQTTMSSYIEISCCSVKKSVLSRFWIHLSVFPNKLHIKIKLIVQAFQIYNHLLTEIIIKRIIWHQRREHW
jgi:hypothetical protein